MNTLNGLVSDVVWRIEIKQKAESNKNVKRLAKILQIMYAVEGKWDEKQEEYAYVHKGRWCRKMMKKLTCFFVWRSVRTSLRASTPSKLPSPKDRAETRSCVACK